MKLLQIWDYLMRRKPLLVALFVVIMSGFCGYRFAAQRHSVSSEALAPIPVVKTIDNGLELHVLDDKQSPVYQLTFSDNFQQAAIEVNANSLASETYVRILDATGSLVAGEYTVIYDRAKDVTEESGTGVKYYFPETPKSYQVALTPGMQIELQAQNVRFYSTLDGAEVTEYTPRAQSETYIVTAGGLRRADWSEIQAQEIIYRQLQRYASQEISAYQASIPEHVLYNKTLDAAKKSEIARLYAQLLPQDKESYSEFVEQLQKGGAPVITYRGATEYKLGETVDLLELLDIHDNEDGEIAKENLNVEGGVDFTQPGSYDVVYTVTDSDGNTTQLTLTIVISETKVDAPDQIPSEDRPVNKPSDGNAGDGSVNGDTDGAVVEQPAGIGAGVGVGETVMDEAGTVWGALEAKVDYAPAATEMEASEEVGDVVEDKTKAITSDNSSQKVSQRAEQTNETSSGETTKDKTSGSSVFLIILGILAFCGLTKFIFDHYIR